MADERARQLAAASSRVVLRSSQSPMEDMRAERARASFDSQELANHLNEGADKLRRRWGARAPPRAPQQALAQSASPPRRPRTCRKELIQFLHSQPWADKGSRYHWTRKEEYVNGLKGILGVWCARAAAGRMIVLVRQGAGSATSGQGTHLCAHGLASAGT